MTVLGGGSVGVWGGGGAHFKPVWVPGAAGHSCAPRHFSDPLPPFIGV